MDLVAILNLEGGELFGRFLRSAVRRKVQSQHGALLVGLQSLHFDVSQSGRRQDSARQIQNLGQRAFSPQFVNRGAPHHSTHRNLCANGRNHQRVTVLQPLEFGTYAMQQQVISVNLFDELLAPVVFQVAQRASRRDASCGKQSVERRRKRTDIVSPRRDDLSDDEVADIVWSMNAAEYWVLLVHQRHWTPKRFGEWLADAWARSLLSQ